MMLETEELLHPRPKRIDIYVDGSWNGGGRTNPAKAGGWGALIRETYSDGSVEEWTPSEPTPRSVKSAGAAEAYAGLAALRAVSIRESHRPSNEPLPEIVLHTDQMDWKKAFERAAAQPEKFASPDSHFKEMVALAISMDVTVEYTSHNKGDSRTARKTDDSRMEVPHRLAAREVLLSRVQQQGGQFKLGPATVVHAETEEERRRLAKRMYPLPANTSPSR